MDKRSILSVLGAGVLLISACAPTPAAAPAATQSSAKPAAATQPAAASQASTVSNAALPQTGDATAVAKAYIEMANTGNFEKTLEFYAPDAVVFNPLGLFVGTRQISNWLKQDVQTTRATPAEYKMEGPFVVVTGQVSLARFKQMGIDPVNFRSDYLVGKDGKIHFFSPTVMLTPEQQAKMKTAGAPAAPTPAVDPLSVAKAYVETANRGDFDPTLAFYADNSAALVMNGAKMLTDRQQIAEWLKQDVQTTRATPQDWQVVNGNTVINTGTVSLARFKALGIDSVKYRAIYLIENGKIRFFRPTAMLTPEQQAIVAAAQQATPTP